MNFEGRAVWEHVCRTEVPSFPHEISNPASSSSATFTTTFTLRRSESHRLGLLGTRFVDSLNMNHAGPPVRNVHHRVEPSHWRKAAVACVRYSLLVCAHYFLACQADVGGAICYAETVHADQTCNSVWGLSTPLTQTRKLCWLSRRAFMAMVNFRA